MRPSYARDRRRRPGLHPPHRQQRHLLPLRPKRHQDETSDCTKQAIAFTEHLADFEAAGAKIIGISPDKVAKHDKFIAKHELKITLGADEDKAVAEAYGVWVEKSMYGRKYMGIERSTFLVGADGKIAQAWRKVKVPGHVEKVLAAVKEL